MFVREDIKLVDITSEVPEVTTDEGTLQGPTQYSMVLEVAPGEQLNVPISSDTHSVLADILPKD